MSNRMVIQPTIFEDAFTHEKSYGVRVYDDYAQAYDNSWDDIPSDDMEILKNVVESNDEVIGTMLDHVKENHKGLSIGFNYYDWDKIKEAFGVEVE